MSAQLFDNTELRIGSWANLVAAGKIVRRAQISAIDEDLGPVGHSDTGHVTGPVLQPIELTEKILEAFGFERNPQPAGLGLYDDFRHKEWRQFTLGRTKVGAGGWLVAGVSYGRPFKHLHQLQNVFKAITGKELELNKEAKGGK